MSDTPRYQPFLLKVSGEALGQPGRRGVDARAVADLVHEIAPVIEMGVQTALVVGGGNLLRGKELAHLSHVARATADSAGMLATVMNALILRDSFEGAGIAAAAITALAMPTVCEPFRRRRAIRQLEEGRLLLLGGGTGSPFFTTDTCAALRALELDAEVLLKATNVDGVYDADPAENPYARRYDRLTYETALAERLAIMDVTAFAMCMAAGLPTVVFRLSQPGNLARVVRGEAVGTLVSAEPEGD